MFNINGPSGPTSRHERPMRDPNAKKTSNTRKSVPWTSGEHPSHKADKENCISTLFQGCNFYFNGRTGNVSSYYLIKMVKAHGGSISIMHRKSRVTHVIATNLSGSKTEAVLQSRVTHVIATNLSGSKTEAVLQSRVTHVIATNLSGSKTEAVLQSGGRIHCVQPQWILDSIEKGKRQPEAKYVVCKDMTVAASGASFFQPQKVRKTSSD
ncbi:hypothetical protein AeMF1_018033 [Aphanomyces euteiches]|nr:hypothetical protein AeMF1_018033 [Aphanomyces euteiches]